MTQQTITITNYKCTECEVEIPFTSSQARYATITALTAKVIGGMPYAPEKFIMCEECEANLETPYDF